ncbi:MAG: CHASE2 domain-containing protein, partial [Rhizobium sp.]|nr:CHASE2 domain-containing protein [Rhizobium sp.]
APTGDVIFVAIDKQSLDKIGVWPWDRSVHARLIDILAKAEARDIFLDVDFSSRSSETGDQALALALETAGGGVILPTFTQYRSSGDRSGTTDVTAPHPLFADRAWTASVSVRADADGVVRTFAYGEEQDGEFVMSVPAALAGKADKAAPPFLIDFSIDPASLVSHSAIDVASGRVDPAAFKDKIVVVGAAAIELRDNFLVPVHGLVSGPILQSIATETLLQDRTLTPLRAWPLLILCAGLGFVSLSPRRSLPLQFLLIASAVVALETAGLWLQSAHALVLPTAASQVLLGLVVVTRILEELDLRTWLLRLASVEADNSRSLLGQVISDSADAILVIDEDGILIAHSTRIADVLPELASLEDGDAVMAILPEAWRGDIEAAIADLRRQCAGPAKLRELSLFEGAGVRTIEYTITASQRALADGKNRRGEDHAFVACVTARDITERRRQEERIGFLSRHDVLTGALRSS